MASAKADDPLTSVFRERWSDELADWRSDNLAQFSYDEDGVLKSVENSRWSQGNQVWVPLTLEFYTYDDDGLVTEFRTEIWNGMGYANLKRDITERDTSNNAIIVKEQSWVNGAWQTQVEFVTIRENDRVVEGSNTTYVNGVPNLTTRFLFEYDDQDREILLTVEEWDAANQSWLLAGRRITEHTDSSSMATAQIYQGNDQWEDVFYQTRFFNTRGLNIEEINVAIAPGGLFEDRILRAYPDDLDLPIEVIEQIKDNNGEWLNVRGNFLTYDQDGDILLLLNQLYDPNAPGKSSSTNGEAGWLNVFRDIFTFGEPVSTETAFQQSFSLDLYPNPFSTKAAIDLQLTNAGKVTIQIFDLLGREVETIVNETMPASATRFTWTPNNLSAGVYFVRVQTNAQVEVKSVVYIQ